MSDDEPKITKIKNGKKVPEKALNESSIDSSAKPKET